MLPKAWETSLEGGIPTEKTMASKSEPGKRAAPTLAAFIFTLLGAVASTIVLTLSLIFQLTIRFPELLSLGLENQIAFFLFFDVLTLIGGIMMYIGALLIFLQRRWPTGAILAILGAIVTVALYSMILGFIGGIIGFCSSPEHTESQ
ncbi:MAG: hypothetical protein ACFFDP_06195 [Promethearchaeota archaeon]